MELLASFIQTSIEHGYFGTALMLLICFGCWRLYKAEQERGQEFSTKFAAELRTLINENNEAQQSIITLIKDMSLKQEMENKHNAELRGRLESEFKELKSELHHLEDEVKDLKRFNNVGGGFNASSYAPRRSDRFKDDYDRD